MKMQMDTEELVESEMDADSEYSANELSSEDFKDEEPLGNPGWADAMQKILNSAISKQNNLILSKAKKDSDRHIVKDKSEIEIVDESGRVVKPEVTTSLQKQKISHKQRRKEILEKQRRKYLWENLCRVKPGIEGKEKERTLIRIATKGVVQLFNAVEQHQKTQRSKRKVEDTKEKTVAKVKGSFLDRLKRNINQEVIDNKDEGTKEESWSVLKDDFMMGATLKDWDKDSEGSESPDENK